MKIVGFLVHTVLTVCNRLMQSRDYLMNANKQEQYNLSCLNMLPATALTVLALGLPIMNLKGSAVNAEAPVSALDVEGATQGSLVKSSQVNLPGTGRGSELVRDA
jgi:hypothetical protein